MFSGRLALQHATRRAQLHLLVSLPPLAPLAPVVPLVCSLHRHRFASSNAPGPKKPVPSPAIPAVPTSAMSTSLPGARAAPQEQSQELAAIQSRLDAPLFLKPGSPWGYAVVRTVYGPGTDAPWRRILALLAESARDTCAFYANAGDLPDRHVLTPIEDAARLDAASSHTVRSVFQQWAAAEKQAWAAQPDALDVFLGTRYNFCLYFDRVCLESLEHEQPQPVVKLLVKDWQPAEALDDDARSSSSSTAGPPGHWEDGVTDEAEEDVGWMYIDLDGYVDTYGQLDDPDWWHELYVRAPEEHPIFVGPRRKGDP